MKTKHLFFLSILAIALIAMAGMSTKSQFTTQTNGVGLIAGRNVNMVSGTDWPGGDPWLQRQNEPSMAVSTRNPMNILAGSNDYRSLNAYYVDELPGFELGNQPYDRDAWLGVYLSYDGGESWKSTLLPGYWAADTTPNGAPPSPLLGYEAAADPCVRAGTNGRFYYSGITFNRGERGVGQVFVARFVDNNNKESGSIEYIDTKIIDVGTSGHFLDLPNIAVDIPRGAAPTTGLSTMQAGSCGNVFMVYTSFQGEIAPDKTHSKILFSMSKDCGETWSPPMPTQLQDAGQPYQGARVVVNPADGRPYIIWRRFAKSETDAIMMCWAEEKSWRQGKIKFSKPIVVYEIAPFDQPTSEWTFRSNDYPALAINSAGDIFAAWSQRGLGPQGEAKIMMRTSSDGGQTWSGPAMLDGTPDSGYQFMPALTIGPGGKVMALWYDQRYDVCGHFEDPYIQEFYPTRHTIDVRAAEVHSIPNVFGYFSDESIQVSRYPWIFTYDDPENPIAMQLQWNMPNLRMFGGGDVPFMGDMIDIAPSPMFVPDGNGWAYNTDPLSKPIYHAVWTDNRDVRPLGPGGDTTYYVAPGEGCDELLDGNKTGTRNQNIYTVRIIEGIIAGSPGNTKPLNIDRAFVVFVKNPFEDEKVLNLSILSPDATAYFMKAGVNVGSSMTVIVPPHSSVSTTVMVESSLNEYATVRIDVKENGTLLTYVLLNPDSTNPGLEPHDGWDGTTPHVGSEGETYTPHVGSTYTVNWDYSVDNPHVGSDGWTSPHVGSNDDWCSPHVGSDDDIYSGSTIHVGENGHIIMSDIINPHVGSSDFDSAPLNGSMTDIVWTVENLGNTTTTFSLDSFPFYDYDPEQIAVQLLIYKVYTTPTALGCELFEQEHHELIVNKTSPHVGSGGGFATSSVSTQGVPSYFSDVTFNIPPKGEDNVEYKVILRYMDMDLGDGIELDPGDQGIIVVSEADGGAVALQIKTRNRDMDNGAAGSLYEETLEVVGGYGNYVWTLGGDAANWLSIDSTSGVYCYVRGTPPTAGTYSLTVTVDDTETDRPPLTTTKTLSIIVYDQLNITTTSLPDGIVGTYYNQTLAAEGGYGEYTWSLVSGTLPDELSLSPGGVIDGTLASQGTFNFMVEVTDSSNPPQTAQQSLSINVIPPHTVTLPDTPSGPTSVTAGVPSTYSTGNSVCVWGHGVEYQFDWGDGNQSGWSDLTSASHSWITAGTYYVTAQARCASNNDIVSSWSDALTVTVNAPIPVFTKIAYIYSTDSESANSYKAFLEDKGYPTSLIHIDSIAAGIFTDTLILIGADTGREGAWGQSAIVDAVNNSGQPIIGLGQGGHDFFGKLSLTVGYADSWDGKDTNIVVVDSSHDVFNTPNNLGVTTGQTISIYSKSTHIGINLPVPLPPNVVLLGRNDVRQEHYPLVQEAPRYLLWGWNASPDSMTQIGKDLFENAVKLMTTIPF